MAFSHLSTNKQKLSTMKRRLSTERPVLSTGTKKSGLKTALF